LIDANSHVWFHAHQGDHNEGDRDWRLSSLANEEGDLTDLRAILGNDIAIKACREAKLPFPDGTIIARLAWSYVPTGC
jgi:Cytochrome P460